MSDVLSCIVIVILGVTVATVGTMRASRMERTYVPMSLLMHFVLAIANYEIMERVFVISDVHGYLEGGEVLASLIEVHPLHWTFEIAKAACFLPSELPQGTGPTGNMVSAAAIGLVLTRSVWGIFLLFAGMSFLGKWALFRAVRDELKTLDERAIAFVTMLVPSYVFWTSGLVKEAFAMAGLGVLVRGAQLLLRAFNLTALVFVVCGLLVVADFKPYFLLSFVVGVGFWILFAKIERAPKFAPVILVIGLVVGVGGLVLLGKQFEDYSIDNLGQSIARQQAWVRETQGGSDYAIGDATQRSLAGQAVYAPIALVTTFARPFPTEARGLTSAISSIEMLLMTILLLRALARTGLRRAGREVLSNGMLIFAAAFLLIGGTGVGLATTNLGTLSRYRTPLLPFYALLIVVFQQAAARRVSPPRPRMPLRLHRRLARSSTLENQASKGSVTR
ncbi:hypothetical protein AKJ09_07803 [Labilithrix luteola]|uniref:Uncharacterized protein n=1 Tax=Labilithrix luteola TaxID=1391654 RepID=A0A0K1Q6V9_9BACT|nr:hypothetical protein [Labilithrix luteola]AKV01140.1 hypothetical protein AKJ09_07803 [Labilithrix luteola]